MALPRRAGSPLRNYIRQLVLGVASPGSQASCGSMACCSHPPTHVQCERHTADSSRRRCLPLCPVNPASEDHAMLPSQLTPHEQPILVADDDKVTRDTVRDILEDAGYRSILEAPDGQHALDILRTSTQRLVVILDWLMPHG